MVKGEISSDQLVRSIRYAIERKQAEEHQKLQAQIIDQIIDGIVVTDLNGNLIFWNKGAEKLFGYSADEILGQSITMVFPSHQVSFFSRGIPLDIIEKGWHETELKFLSKTGKEIPVHVVLAVFKDTKGAVIGMIGSVTDITERKQAESKILESEERYRSLFMNMLNGFAYCRMLFDQNDAQDFIYLEVNDAFEKLTDLKNVVGKKATEVIPGIREADPELFKVYGDVALTGKPKTFEIYIKSLREWHSVTLYSPRKGYFISIFEVITERKQAEIALQVSQRGLEEAQNLAGIGSWEYDIAADKTIWSKKMFDLFGRDPALGEPSWQEHRPYIHPDDWETLDSAVKSGKGYNIEFRLLHPACGVRWSHTIALTESDENGKVVKLKGTVQDITESKLAEEKISNQLDELLRWQNVMLDREDRVQELKQEVNLLLNNGSQPPRYPSD